MTSATACLFRFPNVGFRSTQDRVWLERNFRFRRRSAFFFRCTLSAIADSNNIGGEIRGNEFRRVGWNLHSFVREYRQIAPHENELTAR